MKRQTLKKTHTHTYIIFLHCIKRPAENKQEKELLLKEQLLKEYELSCRRKLQNFKTYDRKHRESCFDVNAAEWLRGGVQILKLMCQTPGHRKPEVSLENRR